MLINHINDLINEYAEAVDIEEVNMLDEVNKETGRLASIEVQEASAEAHRRFGEEVAEVVRPTEEVAEDSSEVVLESVDEVVVEKDEVALLNARIAELEARIAAAENKPPVKTVSRTRKDRKYRLVKIELGEWATQYQVHALVSILAAHMVVGDVAYESDIVRMMEENKNVLRTKQTAKRIWDYYKGGHDRGLTAHGNIEEVK